MIFVFEEKNSQFLIIDITCSLQSEMTASTSVTVCFMPYTTPGMVICCDDFIIDIDLILWRIIACKRNRFFFLNICKISQRQNEIFTVSINVVTQEHVVGGPKKI